MSNPGAGTSPQIPTVTLEQLSQGKKGGPVGTVSQANINHNNVKIIVLTKI